MTGCVNHRSSQQWSCTCSNSFFRNESLGNKLLNAFLEIFTLKIFSVIMFRKTLSKSINMINLTKTWWPLLMTFYVQRLQSHYMETLTIFTSLPNLTSLYLTTKSPGSPGTHLMDLGRMNAYVDFEVRQGFWTQDPWIGNPLSEPLGHLNFKILLSWLFYFL